MDVRVVSQEITGCTLFPTKEICSKESTVARHFKIVEGPSKFDLIVSLAQGDHAHRISVKFKIQEYDTNRSAVATARINVLKRSGPEGEEWIFEGRIDCKKFGLKDMNYSGDFSHQRRDGRMTIKEQ